MRASPSSISGYPKLNIRSKILRHRQLSNSWVKRQRSPGGKTCAGSSEAIPRYSDMQSPRHRQPNDSFIGCRKSKRIYVRSVYFRNALRGCRILSDTHRRAARFTIAGSVAPDTWSNRNILTRPVKFIGTPGLFLRVKVHFISH